MYLSDKYLHIYLLPNPNIKTSEVYNLSMYVAIDLGGTSTRIASSKDLENIFKFEKFSTERNLNLQRELISSIITNITSGGSIQAICLGVPGTIDRGNRLFLNLPNYNVLNNRGFMALIPQEYLSIPLFVANDAALAGYAEAIKGAGSTFNKVLYLTISTGVGGSLIVNKNKEDVEREFEPGHKIIYADGKDFEQHASGAAFEKIYGIDPSKCKDKNIWIKYARDLGIGVSKLINFYKPDVIVLGGGVALNNFDLLHTHLLEYLSKQIHPNSQIPQIKLAGFGDKSGIYGGFFFLKEKV